MTIEKFWGVADEDMKKALQECQVRIVKEKIQEYERELRDVEWHIRFYADLLKRFKEGKRHFQTKEQRKATIKKDEKYIKELIKKADAIKGQISELENAISE